MTTEAIQIAVDLTPACNFWWLPSVSLDKAKQFNIPVLLCLQTGERGPEEGSERWEDFKEKWNIHESVGYG